jgi:plasmid maintenance system antidote protein VapI
MADWTHDAAVAHGSLYPVGNYPPRHTLSPTVAAVLTEAHHQTGYSYRRVAAVLGITYPYWWRLCRGERAPSKRVAFRIIDVLGLDQDTADLLLDESVDKRR